MSRWKRGGATCGLGFVALAGCGDTVSGSDSSTATEGLGGSAHSTTGQSSSDGNSASSTDTSSSGGASTMEATAAGGASSTAGGPTTSAGAAGAGGSTGDGAASTSSAGSGGSGGTNSEGDACEVIDGHTYWSVDELECGLGPGGVVTCNWSIQFLAGVFQWSYSDVGETGSYTCDGDVVLGVAGGDRPLQGLLDRTTGELTWDGVVYGLQP